MEKFSPMYQAHIVVSDPSLQRDFLLAEQLTEKKLTDLIPRVEETLSFFREDYPERVVKARFYILTRLHLRNEDKM